MYSSKKEKMTSSYKLKRRDVKRSKNTILEAERRKANKTKAEFRDKRRVNKKNKRQFAIDESIKLEKEKAEIELIKKRADLAVESVPEVPKVEII